MIKSSDVGKELISLDYIVLDLEWNQPVSRQSYPFVKIGEKLPFEIFQVGAIKLNRNFEIVDHFQVTVRLQQYKRLHYMVKRLTGADLAEIAAGKDFAEEILRFKEWCGPDFAFVTWGYDDIPILKQNLAFYGLDTEWCEHWYNLQVVFNRQMDEGKNQRSLEYALDYFGIEANHQLHNALYDAYYTAQVACRLNLKDGFSEYEQSVWKMRPQKVAKSKRVGAYQTKKAALATSKVSRLCCPVCGRLLLERARWKGSPDGGYWTEISCKTHGPFTARLRFKRIPEGWQVTRTIKNTKPKTKKEPEAIMEVSGDSTVLNAAE